MIKKTSILLCLLWSVFSIGQTSEKSPYSFFGIGDESTQKTVASMGMGGLTVGLKDSYELNFDNPALLSGLKLTSFDLAGQTKFLTIANNLDKQSSSNTTLSYLALGFPITKKMGFMVGLQPNSNVGYKLTDETFIADNQLTEISLYEGSGGTNRMVLGLGYEVYKGVSVGLETAFLFGTINKILKNEKAGVARYNQYIRTANLHGSSLKLGLSYKDSIFNDLTLKTEIATTFGNTINSTNDEFLYSYSYSPSGNQIPQDTLVANYEIDRKIERPILFHTGIGLGKPNQWYTGIEYSTQKAWTFPSGLLEDQKIKYTTRNKFILGGYYIPKVNSITSYWKRVTYRAGLKYETPGLSVKNFDNPSKYTPINDFGISFGLGLPMGNRLSRLNLGIELGQRGSTSGGLIKENYINLRFGLNIAEKWFQERKID